MVEPDENEYVKIDQEQYTKCFVCYLDILGFKNLVAGLEPNTLNLLLENLRNNFRALTGSLLRATSLVQTAILVSDSILLFTKNDSEEDFKYLVGSVAAAMCVSLSPMRGAISHGVTLDELQKNLKEVLELCLEEFRGSVEDLPHFVGLQQIEVAV